MSRNFSKGLRPLSPPRNHPWVKHLIKRHSNLHAEKGLILRQFLIVNQLGGLGACSPGRFCKVDLLKSLEMYIFLFLCASSKLSRRATKLHAKETLPETLKVGAHAFRPPLVSTFMLQCHHFKQLRERKIESTKLVAWLEIRLKITDLNENFLMGVNFKLDIQGPVILW